MAEAQPEMRILPPMTDGVACARPRVLEEIARTLSDDIWWWRLGPISPASPSALALTIRCVCARSGRATRRQGYADDCVIMAARHIIPQGRPDLLLSGVNRGRNAAEDVTYSGTVAGAIGVRCWAYRLCAFPGVQSETRKAPHWRPRLKFGPDSSAACSPRACRATSSSISIPGLRAGQVKASGQQPGQRPQELLRIEPRRDGRGQPYYWIATSVRPAHTERDGTDLSAPADNRISVTPLRPQQTDEPFLTRLAEIFRVGWKRYPERGRPPAS